jgi:hypothetical protein
MSGLKLEAIFKKLGRALKEKVEKWQEDTFFIP